MPESLIFCGRTFASSELELMRQIAAEFSALGVTEIARTVCELLEWKRSSGRLKNHECRQLLERLQTEGFLKLPELRNRGGRGPRRVDLSEPALESPVVEWEATECEPLELTLVEGKAQSRLWRDHMERYHYLGCRVPFGANLRYWVRSRDQELACLLWTSPAWRMQARDAWIGWNDQQRQANLQAIIHNGRFLILPWVRVKGLASKILALSARKNAARLGDPLRVSAAVVGNARRRGSFSGDLLPRRQLDPRRPDHRARPHGPRAQGSRSGGQRHLRLSPGARCPAASMPRSSPVNKYN